MSDEKKWTATALGLGVLTLWNLLLSYGLLMTIGQVIS